MYSAIGHSCYRASSAYLLGSCCGHGTLVNAAHGRGLPCWPASRAEDALGLQRACYAVVAQACARRRGWDMEYFSDEGASGKYINGNLRLNLHGDFGFRG